MARAIVLLLCISIACTLAVDTDKLPKKDNCVIVSSIGKLYNDHSMLIDSKTQRLGDVTPLEWVLSFAYTFNAESGGNTWHGGGYNGDQNWGKSGSASKAHKSDDGRCRFSKGASVVIHQWEKLNISDSKELTQEYQKWSISADGYITTVYNGYAIAVEGARLNPGTKVVMWPQYPGTNEQWWMDAKGRIISKMPGSSVCLEVDVDLKDGKDLLVKTASFDPATDPPIYQQWWIQCE